MLQPLPKKYITASPELRIPTPLRSDQDYDNSPSQLEWLWKSTRPLGHTKPHVGGGELLQYVISMLRFQDGIVCRSTSATTANRCHLQQDSSQEVQESSTTSCQKLVATRRKRWHLRGQRPASHLWVNCMGICRICTSVS